MSEVCPSDRIFTRFECRFIIFTRSECGFIIFTRFECSFVIFTRFECSFKVHVDYGLQEVMLGEIGAKKSRGGGPAGRVLAPGEVDPKLEIVNLYWFRV